MRSLPGNVITLGMVSQNHGLRAGFPLASQLASGREAPHKTEGPQASSGGLIILVVAIHAFSQDMFLEKERKIARVTVGFFWKTDRSDVQE